MFRIVLPTEVEWEGSPYKKPHWSPRVSSTDALKAFLLCGAIAELMGKLGECVEILRVRAVWVEWKDHRQNGPDKPEFWFDAIVNPDHLKKEEFRLVALSHDEFQAMDPGRLTPELVEKLRSFVVGRYDARIQELQVARIYVSQAVIG